MPSILVIAPDPDLRHSLAFLLAAEGFTVESGSAWPVIMSQALPDAVVIDHAAFPKGYPADDGLITLGSKLVILAGRDRNLPNLPCATVIRKPLLDKILVETLQALVPRAIGR